MNKRYHHSDQPYLPNLKLSIRRKTRECSVGSAKEVVQKEGKEEWDIPGDGTATGKHAKMATSVLRE